ncbi:MAG: hypothetical protein KAU14_05175 [Thermoplasmata archaeon]|nr:hypothetical protein [Thermoplasmata archaeon]
MADQTRNRREVAWRIFAREYNASRYVIKKEEEMAPSYVISPLGAMANRVYISGVVTEVENIGTDNEPFWRVRVTDPTGVFYLSAGQYQPEASKTISKLKVPSFVSVLGKTRTYTPEGGSMYVSILPETIVEADRSSRDLWILDTVKKTRERLNCITEALAMESPVEEELMEMGFPRVVANGALKAIEMYDKIPLEEFREMLLDPLRTLTEAEDEFLTAQATRGISEEESSLRKELLRLIEELDTNGEGAVYQELMEKVVELKMDRDETEDTITKLLDDGHLFEPVLGRLKRV